MKPRWVIVENVNRMKRWERHDELLKTIGAMVNDQLRMGILRTLVCRSQKLMVIIC